MLKQSRSCRFRVGMVLLLFVTTPHFAEDKKAAGTTTRPTERLGQRFWKERHEKFLARAKMGEVDVLFLGDSITQGWESAGKEAWKKHFERLKAANFGISGDRTEHVLWRITLGRELEGFSPRVAVLMIGTNNSGANTAEDVAEGITAIVKELQRQKPQMKVLLLGVFPRSPKAIDKVRDKIKEINGRIAKLDDGKRVVFLDIGGKFVAADGSLTKDIMPDYLHLSPRGYEIWAEAIQPTLRKLLD